MTAEKDVAWDVIELDYRAGVKTLRQIAEEHGITHGAINKRAKRDGWTRDLSAKIAAKADELVSRAAVSRTVSKEQRILERQVVDNYAEVQANAIIVTIPDPGLDLIDFYNFLASELNMGRTFTHKSEFLIHFKRLLISTFSTHLSSSNM